MASAQLGHEADYRQLLGEVGDAVSHYLRSRFGAHDMVEDCVQDVLIAVHQARHSYDPQRQFRPWLFAIVRHKSIDHLRRRGRHPSTESLEEGAMLLASAGDSMENTVAGGHMIRALAAPQREAIVLTKIVGLSTAEAAARLAISESALKVRVHRGVSRLRRLLEGEAL